RAPGPRSAVRGHRAKARGRPADGTVGAVRCGSRGRAGHPPGGDVVDVRRGVEGRRERVIRVVSWASPPKEGVMELLDQVIHAPQIAPRVTEEEERAARRTLREQIARLERELSDA